MSFKNSLQRYRIKRKKYREIQIKAVFLLQILELGKKSRLNQEVLL